MADCIFCGHGRDEHGLSGDAVCHEADCWCMQYKGTIENEVDQAQAIFFCRVQELLVRMPSGTRRIGFKLALMQVQKLTPEQLVVRLDELLPHFGIPPIER